MESPSHYHDDSGPASPYHAFDAELDERRTPSRDRGNFRAADVNATTAMNGEAGTIDKQSIRNEWVDSLFGKDFFPREQDPCPIDYTPALKGVGTANVPSYVAYSATIYGRPPNEKEKIGVTISRLPLGVYVHAVDPGSEAYNAGVIPGSILVDVNGMGVLGEPSHKLIERLWQYEGFSVKEGNKGTIDGLLVLRFIKNGKMYDAMFLNKPPFGISWAPCGNFALVQRSYSFAQAAGIKRGCIIASVNGKSFRNLDHVSAAETLRHYYCKREKITMTLVYTPAASRSNFFATLQASQNSPQKTTNKPHSIPISTLLQNSISCGSSSQIIREPVIAQRSDQVSKLAERVAAGELQPASSDALKRQTKNTKDLATATTSSTTQTDHSSNGNANHGQSTGEAKYLPCPELNKSDMFDKWNIFNALFYCLKVGMAEYSEENLKSIPQLEDVGNDVNLCVETLEEFGLSEISMFLLQLVGVLGSDEIFGEMGERFGSAIIDLVKESDELCFYFHFLLLACIGNTSSQSSTSYSTLAFVKKTLTTRLAEVESTTSMMQLQSQSHSMENLSIQEKASPISQSRYSPNNKSFHRVQDIVEEIFDEINMEKQHGQQTESMAYENNDSNQGDGKKKKKKGFMKRLFRKKSKGIQSKVSSDVPQASPDDFLKDHSSASPLASPAILQSSSFPAISTQGTDRTPPPILRSRFHKSNTPFEINNAISTVNTHEFGYPTYMSSHIKEMENFLTRMDNICENIQNLLIKSNSQKVVEWAMPPWNATKEKTLSEATEKLRSGLKDINMNLNFPLINPVDATELLSRVDPDESFILPSAHCPLLLSFDHKKPHSSRSEDDVLYRTKVEVIALRGGQTNQGKREESIFFVQGSVAGQVQETGKSTLGSYFESTLHRWYNGNVMTFDTRSSWGSPKTLSIKMKAVDPNKMGVDQSAHGDDDGISQHSTEVGYCWVDLSDMWNKSSDKIVCHAQLYFSDQVDVAFDGQGYLDSNPEAISQRLELELRISTDAVTITPSLTSQHPKLCSKKLLLYKHTEDIRQEMLALQFIELSNQLLTSSGLDLKIRTFKYCPVGAKSGFVEWVPGSVPLSEICERGGTASTSHTSEGKNNTIAFLDGMEMEDKSGKVQPEPPEPYDSTSQTPTKTVADKPAQYEVSRFRALKGLSNYTFGFGVGLGRQGNPAIRNPIQDFLRSAAYDPDAPYFINKVVMDTYLKSCAGYCILTYLLGVGDRHLDNLLLHPHGYFIHCDYSFILGQDPKTYIPMRITEEMVMGMGGQDSDNFAKFLSLAGAAFVALRRHSNLRALMSLIRTMVGVNLPDISLNQTAEDALFAMRYRFRLDLNEDDALSFIEKLIETSISSKIWVAVDAMHSFGKKF